MRRLFAEINFDEEAALKKLLSALERGEGLV